MQCWVHALKVLHFIIIICMYWIFACKLWFKVYQTYTHYVLATAEKFLLICKMPWKFSSWDFATSLNVSSLNWLLPLNNNSVKAVFTCMLESNNYLSNCRFAMLTMEMWSGFMSVTFDVSKKSSWVYLFRLFTADWQMSMLWINTKCNLK